MYQLCTNNVEKDVDIQEKYSTIPLFMCVVKY